MTPTEMVRHLSGNIETARAVMEDGATGYVLHTKDYLTFLCKDRELVLRLCSPLSDDVEVLNTERSALVMQRYWNAEDHNGNAVAISLRREAFDRYINVQQAKLDVLLELNKEQP